LVDSADGGFRKDVAVLANAVLQRSRRVVVKDHRGAAPDMVDAFAGVADLDGALVRVLALARNVGCTPVSFSREPCGECSAAQFEKGANHIGWGSPTQIADAAPVPILRTTTCEQRTYLLFR
jgi:hypothetical protein